MCYNQILTFIPESWSWLVSSIMYKYRPSPANVRLVSQGVGQDVSRLERMRYILFTSYAVWKGHA